MQMMPDIWDDDLFMTSRSAVLGTLACCAVRQSPYTYPDNLAQGLAEFRNELLVEHFETSYVKLRKQIREMIDKCPMILDWNKPRKDEHTIVFCSRPAFDYDFIDLDALARNVAQMVTLEAKYNKLHQ